MKKKMIIIGIIAVAMFAPLIMGNHHVSAQSGFCDFFPCDDTPGDDTSSVAEIDTWVEFGAGLVFVGFIIFGILMIIKASLKIIRSEGDEGQVQEGMIAIRSVMIAVGMLIFGIVGLILLLGIFGKSDFTGPELVTPPGVNELPFIT